MDTRSPGEQIEELILAGESDQLEYKQQLGEDKVNVSFARTVSAFANGGGGRILVGIAPDTSVIGWAPKDGRDQIAAIIRDNVRELPAFTSYPVSVRGKKILLVDVQAGTARPYLCRDVCFVRVQATTRRAEPHEIASLATPASSPLNSLDRLLER